jgi:uncharacterized protein (DUF2249 family)
MSTSAKATIDVRPLHPRDKHPQIFATFDTLQPGEVMLLINDHDPTPLKYQFGFERPELFTWTPVEQGPVEWRIEIGRV